MDSDDYDDLLSSLKSTFTGLTNELGIDVNEDNYDYVLDALFIEDLYVFVLLLIALHLTYYFSLAIFSFYIYLIVFFPPLQRSE